MSRYSLSIVFTSPNSIVRQFPGRSRPALVSSFVGVLATSLITSARSSVQLLCPASLLSSFAPVPPALLATAIPAARRRSGGRAIRVLRGRRRVRSRVHRGNHGLHDREGREGTGVSVLDAVGMASRGLTKGGFDAE